MWCSDVQLTWGLGGGGGGGVVGRILLTNQNPHFSKQSL